LRMSPHFNVFSNVQTTTEISPLSLHAALPISNPRRKVHRYRGHLPDAQRDVVARRGGEGPGMEFAWSRDGTAVSLSVDQGPGCADRKSTRLNSSHVSISYAVFCLKKKI